MHFFMNKFTFMNTFNIFYIIHKEKSNWNKNTAIARANYFHQIKTYRTFVWNASLTD